MIHLLQSCIQNDEPVVKIMNGDTYDFGQATVGDTLVHNFLISNEGNELLKIEKVQPGCACTIMNFPKNTIASKVKTSMQVVFVSREQDVGYCEKLIAFRTNATPSIYVLHIKGIVNSKKVL